MAQETRVTSRCLNEDLVDDWPDADIRRAIEDGRLHASQSELDHPVVVHLRATFPHGSDDAQRTSISAVTDRTVWRLKTQRWRGAVWEDKEGIAWLCAAGLCRDGDTDDFYSEFAAACKQGSQQFLPSEEDYELARRDAARTSLATWESVLTAAVRAPISTLTTGEAAQSSTIIRIADPANESSTIATATLSLMAEPGGGADDLVDVCIDVIPADRAYADVIAHAELVLMLAIEPYGDEWDTTSNGQSMIYSAVITVDAVSRIRRFVAASNVDVPEPLPPRNSHRTHVKALAGSYVNGMPVRALCGRVFVPTRDPQSQAECEMCARLMKLFGT